MFVSKEEFMRYLIVSIINYLHHPIFYTSVLRIISEIIQKTKIINYSLTHETN